MIRATFTKNQADFIARMLKSFLDQTEVFKFDATIMPIRRDAHGCLNVLKSSGASEK